MMKRTWLLSLVVLTSLATAHADNCGSLPSPGALKSRIEAAQDRESFLKIFNMKLGSHPSTEWTCFLDRVARGEESYGPALMAMSKKPFWLGSPEVTEALSQALTVRPAFVLKIIAASANPIRTTEVICQIGMPSGIRREKADAALAQVRASLATVEELSLLGTRQGCFDSLDSHMSQWKHLRQEAPEPDEKE